MFKTCGNCDYADGFSYANKKIRCSVTGKFYDPYEPCEILIHGKEETTEQETIWNFYNPEKNTGICGNCNRLDHVDPLATHCRYCGIKIKLPPKKEKKVTDKWIGPFKSIQSETTLAFECPECGMYSYLPNNDYKHYVFCPWCGEKIIKEEWVYE